MSGVFFFLFLTFFSSSSASKSRSRGKIQALQYENVLYSLNGMPIADKIILLTLFIPCIKNVIYYCKSNTIHLSSFCASHLTADFSPDRNQRSGTVGVAEGGGLSGYHDTKIYTYKRLWGKKMFADLLNSIIIFIGNNLSAFNCKYFPLFNAKC